MPLGSSLIYTYKQDVTDPSEVLLSCFEVDLSALLLAKVGLGIIYEVAIVLGKIYFQKSLTFLDIWCN